MNYVADTHAMIDPQCHLTESRPELHPQFAEAEWPGR